MTARRFPSGRSQGRRSAEDYAIVIAYDGARTEDEYFRGWQLYLGSSRLSIEPLYVTSGGNPLRAIEACRKRIKKGQDYAEFWCVCDVDDANDEAIAEAKILAESLGIRLCLSNRCFEVWIALHYERSAKPILCEADAVDAVKKYIGSYSSRRKSATFSKVWPKTDVALRNAEWLQAQALDNPSTHVNGLVRKLRDNLSSEARSRLEKP